MNKDWKKIFMIIWSGQFISILTSSIVEFAIILWITMKTGSAEVLALSAVASMLPQSLLGPFAGILVDRWPRKTVMIAADSFIALCTMVLAILFYFGEVQIVHIYILMVLRSIGGAFHEPAMQASVPLLAPKEELMRISGINQMIHSVCSIAGPALGALAITLMSMTPVLMLDVAGAAVACISLLFVTIPNPVREGMTKNIHLVGETKEAYAAVRKQRGLGWLFLLMTVSMFIIIPISVLYPLMTLNHFHGNAFQMSVIEMGWGGGALLGGAILGVKKFHWNEMSMISWVMTLLGVAFFFSGVLPSNGYVLFVVITSITGVLGSFNMAAFTTIIQTRIPSEVMGRVLSFTFSVGMLPSMLGLLGTGFLADGIGLTNTFMIGGVLMTIVGAYSFMVPSIQYLKRSLDR
jgi:DHA3 family macrolide efflux protein-like MFS transporter